MRYMTRYPKVLGNRIKTIVAFMFNNKPKKAVEFRAQLNFGLSMRLLKDKTDTTKDPKLTKVSSDSE